MNITLNPDLQKFVDNEVSAGKFANAEAVINEALKKMLLEHAKHLEISKAVLQSNYNKFARINDIPQIHSQLEKREKLKAELKKGEESYRRGDYFTLENSNETQNYFDSLKSKYAL